MTKTDKTAVDYMAPPAKRTKNAGKGRGKGKGKGKPC